MRKFITSYEKSLILFLAFGLIFVYTGCIRCNCEDINSKTVIETGNYEDSDILTRVYEFRNSWLSEIYDTNATLKANFVIEYTTYEKRIAFMKTKYPNCTHSGGSYGLMACKCPEPYYIDNTIRHKDTIIRMEVRTLYDLGATYKKGDIINDSIFTCNPYQLQQTTDTSITKRNNRKSFKRMDFMKINCSLKRKTAFQFVINVQTKKGKIYQDTTKLVYVKP